MKKGLNKWEKSTILGLVLFLAIGLLNAGIGSVEVQANNTAQTLPFSQNWTNVGLITTTDDWSAVPGIVGFRGDDLVTATDTDLRTILADGSTTPVDVNANQTNPDTFTSGGVTEFEITNPVVALQGSGTADVPHLVVYLNTTGQSNVRFSYNARDVDGAADDAVQQINTQYRVGNTGDFINLTGGYIADATTGGTATQVTAVNVTLPADANNQAMVQVRVMTTNALGSDEWVGIDDISVTTGGGTTPPAARATLFDFTGNGRTDYTVFSNSFATAGVPIRWSIAANPAAPGPNQAFIRSFDYGLVGDSIVPNDYRGDIKVDVTVRRPSTTAYYVAEFPTGPGPLVITNTLPFGTSADLDGGEGDYDGDGKADYTVVRVTGGNLTYYILLSSTNTLRSVPHGTTSGAADAFLSRGADFNADGRDELIFITVSSNGNINYFVGDAVTGVGVITTQFGNFASDYSVPPADYTGDGRADFIAVRQSSGGQVWYINNSATNAVTATTFGIPDSSTAVIDFRVRGDYDGDGIHDIAVWRRSNQTFYFINSSNRMLGGQKWGESPNDLPLGAFGVN